MSIHLQPIHESSVARKAQNFAKKIWAIAWHSDLHATRFLLGLADVAWAFMLLYPGRSFDRPEYAIMAKAMSDNATMITAIKVG